MKKHTKSMKSKTQPIDFGTTQSKGGRKKMIPPKKVFPIKGYVKPLTILRPVVTSTDEAMVFKFRLNQAGNTIKISTKRNEEKLVVSKTDNLWRLDVRTPKGYDGDHYDSSFHKTAFKAYMTGLSDVWDLAV